MLQNNVCSLTWLQLSVSKITKFIPLRRKRKEGLKTMALIIASKNKSIHWTSGTTISQGHIPPKKTKNTSKFMVRSCMHESIVGAWHMMHASPIPQTNEKNY